MVKSHQVFSMPSTCKKAAIFNVISFSKSSNMRRLLVYFIMRRLNFSKFFRLPHCHISVPYVTPKGYPTINSTEDCRFWLLCSWKWPSLWQEKKCSCHCYLKLLCKRPKSAKLKTIQGRYYDLIGGFVYHDMVLSYPPCPSRYLSGKH